MSPVAAVAFPAAEEAASPEADSAVQEEVAGNEEDYHLSVIIGVAVRLFSSEGR